LNTKNLINKTVKKIIFLLILCLAGINIYAQQRDTIYCKQSEVLQKTPVVLGIPDSVYCDEATPQQNGWAYFQKKPVVFGREQEKEYKGFGIFNIASRSNILVFKKSDGLWKNTKIENLTHSDGHIDILALISMFFVGFFVGMFAVPLSPFKNYKKRKILLNCFFLIVGVILFLMLLGASLQDLLNVAPVIVGIMAGMIIVVFFLFDKLQRPKK